MNIEDQYPETLWLYYQAGYHSLVRSGKFFRQLLRPALSHVYFQRAVPLLQEYARSNRGGDLPPGFGDQMEACPLTPRDLLHLDYAICLGYAESQGLKPGRLDRLPMMEWPGPNSQAGMFIPTDALMSTKGMAALAKDIEDLELDEDLEDIDDDDGGSEPPFDL